MSNFQQTVNIDLNEGVPGDVLIDEPSRITPYTLATAATLGYFCTLNGQTGLASVGGSITGNTVLAGIVANSKIEPLFGSSVATPFSPNLTLNANSQAAFLSMGGIVVSLAAAWNEGDILAYNTTTGVLSTYTPGGSPAGGSATVPNAIMIRYGSTAAGYGIARLTN